MSTKRGSWMVLSTGALAIMAGAWACSGGTEGPTGSGPGPGWDESPVANPPDGEPSPTPTVPVGGGTTATTYPTTTSTYPTTTTTAGCVTCSEVLGGGAIGDICATSAATLASLVECACGGCYDSCYDACTGGDYIDSYCLECGASSCPSEAAACAGN